jgi:hypothetical protein
VAQPTAYTRVYDFSDYQSSNPSTPLPGNQVDAEFDAIKLTTDQIRTNLALIQRDDGALKNGIVTPESLATATNALITVGGSPQGAWVTATAYEIGDVVTEGGATYICNTDHTSGTFATDLAATKWLLVSLSEIDTDSLANGSITAEKLDTTDFTSFSQQLFARGTAALWRTDLGIDGLEAATTFGKSLVAAANDAAARTTLGGGTAGQAVFTAVEKIDAYDAIHANGADIASAGTVDLNAATGDYLTITGTTTITAITLAEGKRRAVRFAGALLLTHGASLVLPGAANITTAQNDTAVFRGESGGVVRCLAYQRASGKQIAAIVNTDLPAGTVVDRAYAEYTSNADLTTAIPVDDTIPQSSEGTQILSASITPKSTTNRIRARFRGQVSVAGAGVVVSAAMFNGGADAIAAEANSLTGSSNYGPITLEYEYVPGATSSITFTVRVGPASSTARMNGVPAGRTFGGVSRATLVLEEIVAS